MYRVAALPVLALAMAPAFHFSIQPLPKPVKAQLRSGGFWHGGCPVARDDLRLLTVTHRRGTRAGGS